MNTLYLFLMTCVTCATCIAGYTEVPVYIALKQHNIGILEDWLEIISNPVSPNYNKWMTADEINNLIHPLKKHQESVLFWLHEYSILNVKNYGDAIKFSTTPNTIKNMFKISDDSIGLTGYTIPVHLRNIIEFVEMESKTLNRIPKRNRKRLDNVTDDRYFGREPLINLYNVPLDSLNKTVSCGLVEYQNNNGFLVSDLRRQQILNEQDINIDVNIIGDNIGTDAESELDVQLVSQAADGAQLWYWMTPYWLYSFAVDFYNSENTPDIISMSWGWAEDSQCDIIDCTNTTSKEYVSRVNTEYLKLALRGITIVASSGDAGAPGRTNQQCDSSRPINPIFPGSSPYVTSVGATFVTVDNTTRNFTTPLCLNDGCITGTNEKSIRYTNTGWTAGGGFNLYNTKTPFWQKRAVKDYLNSGVVLPNESNYNKNGRAYPDLSAIGHSCPTIIGGTVQAIDGTSCSSPVISGLLAIINNFLWNNYKFKLGFANPLLYHIQSYCSDCFRDITDGYNWCTEGSCCENTTDYGFNATKGYDPVSGLGTPNIRYILYYLKTLF